MPLKERAVTHAAGRGQGRDGCRQHGYEHLYGLLLDKCEQLLANGLKEFHVVDCFNVSV